MRTKTKSETKETKSDMTNSKESLICPVCMKKFKPNDNTKYIVFGGYTCSWECFSNEAKKQEIKKKEKENKNRKK